MGYHVTGEWMGRAGEDAWMNFSRGDLQEPGGRRAGAWMRGRLGEGTPRAETAQWERSCGTERCWVFSVPKVWPWSGCTSRASGTVAQRS